MSMTVEKYLEIKKQFDVAKALELEARLALVAKSGHTKVGSKTMAMDGFKVNLINTVNESIHEPMLANALESLGEHADVVFKPKREFSATGFKLLSEVLSQEQVDAVLDAIITKPGTPQFKVVKTPVELAESNKA